MQLICGVLSLTAISIKGFFTALRLVASAQGGSDVSLNSVSQNTPIPKFVSVGTLDNDMKFSDPNLFIGRFYLNSMCKMKDV